MMFVPPLSYWACLQRIVIIVTYGVHGWVRVATAFPLQWHVQHLPAFWKLAIRDCTFRSVHFWFLSVLWIEGLLSSAMGEIKSADNKQQCLGHIGCSFPTTPEEYQKRCTIPGIGNLIAWVWCQVVILLPHYRANYLIF